MSKFIEGSMHREKTEQNGPDIRVIPVLVKMKTF